MTTIIENNQLLLFIANAHVGNSRRTNRSNRNHHIRRPLPCHNSNPAHRIAALCNRGPKKSCCRLATPREPRSWALLLLMEIVYLFSVYLDQWMSWYLSAHAINFRHNDVGKARDGDDAGSNDSHGSRIKEHSFLSLELYLHLSLYREREITRKKKWGDIEGMMMKKKVQEIAWRREKKPYILVQHKE